MGHRCLLVKFCCVLIRCTRAKSTTKALTVDNMNQNLRKMEYAIRGPILDHTIKLSQELKEGKKKPFDKIIRTNIGDAHAMGQKPLTFIRQLIALTAYPPLMKDSQFPKDVVCRAQEILDGCQGNSVGSYTESPGINLIRKSIASFIERRDCFPSDYTNIYLTHGASEAIKRLMLCLVENVNGLKPGLLMPIPVYPLYSAMADAYKLEWIKYYLDEDKEWSLNISELERSIEEAKKRKVNPRGIIIINPGNPTGQVLDKKNVEDIIKFAHKEKLVIFGDEVYQQNIYAKGKVFHSLKKVMMELGEPFSKTELVSFFSVSKGFMGECGLRSGYVELVNFNKDVVAVFHKTSTVSLCACSLGQVAMYAVTNPPNKDEPSYELYTRERDFILSELKKKAELLTEELNKVPGVKCNPIQGAMYSFVKVDLPPKALEAAKAKKMDPSTYYAFEVLNNTGIVFVPGSGFGQKEGTYHFRTTILPPTPLIKEVAEKFTKFQMDFYSKFK